MDTVPAIVTTDLTKRYGRAATAALDRLSIQVMPGEVYGFLGANGAGKSTTIRLLMNFLQPTSGSAYITGLDSVKDSVTIKKQVGYLAGEIALYGKMTARELLGYFAQLQPVDTGYLSSLIERFEADIDRPINALSKGNRQKIGILQAFMHQPSVLILDEPTSGLDPLMQEEFYKVIREQSAAGAAIFVSSHNLTEVQRMCDRVGIIRSGRLITEKSVNDMIGANVQRFSITFAGPVPEDLKHLNKIEKLTIDGHTANLIVAGELQPLLKLLAKHAVTHLQSEQADLEQEFLHYYGEDA